MDHVKRRKLGVVQEGYFPWLGTSDKSLPVCVYCMRPLCDTGRLTNIPQSRDFLIQVQILSNILKMKFFKRKEKV